MENVERLFRPRSKSTGDKCALCDALLSMNVLSPGYYGYFVELTLIDPISIRVVVCEKCMIKIIDFYNARQRERSDPNKNSLWFEAKR